MYSSFNYNLVPPREVPTKEQKESARRLRTKYAGTGAYQIGRENEKRTLLKYLEENTDLSAEDREILIYGVPNAKFGWYNRVIKDAFELEPKKTMNPCDAGLIEKMWTAQGFSAAFTKLKNILALSGDKIGHPDFPTRGNLPFSCEEGQLVTRFKNPGVYNYETGKLEEYDSYEDMFEEIAKYNYFKNKTGLSWDEARKYHNDKKNPPSSYGPIGNLKACGDSQKSDHSDNNGHNCQCQLEPSLPVWNAMTMRKKYNQFIKEMQPIEDSNDTQLASYLGLLVQEFLQGQVSSKTLNILRKKLSTLESDDTNIYLKSLLQPHLRLDAKVPQSIPMPSASFQIKDKFLVTLNATGNAAVAWNPFYLSTANTFVLGVNNNVGLIGTAASNFFLSTASALLLPFAIYSQYRLVSASLSGRYLGSKLNAAGRIDCSTDYSGTAVAPQAPTVAIAEYQKYGNFSQIQNAYFYDSIANSDDATVGVNWFPTDDQMRAFKAIGTINNDSPILLLACIGGQASVPALEVTIVANFEALVENEFTDYIPTTTYKGSIKAREAAKIMIDNAIISGDKAQLETQSSNDYLKDMIVPGPLISTSTEPLVSRYLNWLTDTIPGFKFIKDLSRGENFASSLQEAIKNTNDIYKLVTDPKNLAMFGLDKMNTNEISKKLADLQTTGKTAKEREDATKLYVLLQELMLNQYRNKSKTDDGNKDTSGGSTSTW